MGCGAKRPNRGFQPGSAGKASGYKLKFTPPFRSTLRPPQRVLSLAPRKLEQFRKELNDLFVAADAPAGEELRYPPAPRLLIRPSNMGGNCWILLCRTIYRCS
jgi:hypothetical protein